MSYVLSDNLFTTITYYQDAITATNAQSAAGAHGISLWNKATSKEDMLLKNDKWDSTILDWIKEYTLASPPAELWSDDFGLYDKVCRISFDGKSYKQYDMLSVITQNFRIDNSELHFKRYPPVKPAVEYDENNPPPPFLLPDNFNHNKFVEASVTPGTIMPTLRADTALNKMQTPRPQVQSPKVFDNMDKSYTYKSYMIKCQYYCTATYGVNYTAVQLLQTARSYLGGEVSAFELHDAQRNPTRTPAQWNVMMDKRWTDPNLKSQAVSEMHRMSQAGNEAAHNFITRFDTLAGDAEMDMNHTTTILMFINKLQPELRAAI